MFFSNTSKIIAACVLLAGAAPAFSHIVLESKSAPAGSSYKAVFLVGHGCQGSATTGVAVQIPTGFLGAKPYPKAGWTLSTQLGQLAQPYDSHGKRVTDDVTLVSWTAKGKESALPDAFFDEFVLRGKLPDSAGPLWFKVRQTCASGSNDWSEIPASGTSTRGLKAPAALLEVTTAGSTAPGQTVQVSEGWVRATVPGQKGSGAFMTLHSTSATRLVGVSSPVAGVAEVHEMKMDGDIMRMRQIPGLDLPAGKSVALTSGGYHVMLMDLKQTLTLGSTVPVTLLFKDSQGVNSQLELTLPVATSAPAGGQAGAADHGAHKH